MPPESTYVPRPPRRNLPYERSHTSSRPELRPMPRRRVRADIGRELRAYRRGLADTDSDGGSGGEDQDMAAEDAVVAATENEQDDGTEAGVGGVEMMDVDEQQDCKPLITAAVTAEELTDGESMRAEDQAEPTVAAKDELKFGHAIEGNQQDDRPGSGISAAQIVEVNDQEEEDDCKPRVAAVVIAEGSMGVESTRTDDLDGPVVAASVDMEIDQPDAPVTARGVAELGRERSACAYGAVQRAHDAGLNTISSPQRREEEDGEVEAEDIADFGPSAPKRVDGMKGAGSAALLSPSPDSTGSAFSPAADSEDDRGVIAELQSHGGAAGIKGVRLVAGDSDNHSRLLAPVGDHASDQELIREKWLGFMGRLSFHNAELWEEMMLEVLQHGSRMRELGRNESQATQDELCRMIGLVQGDCNELCRVVKAAESRIRVLEVAREESLVNHRAISDEFGLVQNDRDGWKSKAEKLQHRLDGLTRDKVRLWVERDELKKLLVNATEVKAKMAEALCAKETALDTLRRRSAEESRTTEAQRKRYGQVGAEMDIAVQERAEVQSQRDKAVNKRDEATGQIHRSIRRPREANCQKGEAKQEQDLSESYPDKAVHEQREVEDQRDGTRLGLSAAQRQLIAAYTDRGEAMQQRDIGTREQNRGALPQQGAETNARADKLIKANDSYSIHDVELDDLLATITRVQQHLSKTWLSTSRQVIEAVQQKRLSEALETSRLQAQALRSGHHSGTAYDQQEAGICRHAAEASKLSALTPGSEGAADDESRSAEFDLVLPAEEGGVPQTGGMAHKSADAVLQPISRTPLTCADPEIG